MMAPGSGIRAAQQRKAIMGRSTGLVAVAVFSAIVMGMFANSTSAEAKGNCQAALVGKSYNCSFTDNDFPPFQECWGFFTGGVSRYFDLNNGVDDYGCACDPTGSSNSPSFDNSSNTFECSGSNNVTSFLFNGKIGGKKLSVQGVGSSGEQYVGTCTPRSSSCP
jgi:hypothetical protein